MKSPKTNKKPFKYKGQELVPLASEEAATLRDGDVVKYVGPAPSYYIPDSTHWYHFYRRRPVVLRKMSKSLEYKKELVIYTSVNYYKKVRAQAKFLALVRRGEPHQPEVTIARRYVPHHLKLFKKNIVDLLEYRRNAVDEHLSKMPLHKRMEFFREFTPEQKRLYDALYKDIEALLDLKGAGADAV